MGRSATEIDAVATAPISNAKHRQRRPQQIENQYEGIANTIVQLLWACESGLIERMRAGGFEVVFLGGNT